MTKQHERIILTNHSVRRRPIYSMMNFIGACIALFLAISTFTKSMHIRPTKGYIASTSSDTAVAVIPTDIPLLPTLDQELEPGQTLSQQDSLSSVKSFLGDALKECFTMNYLNYSNVLSKCKYLYLDSESSTSDDFFKLLNESNFLALLKKYQTASTTTIEPNSIELINEGIASLKLPNGVTRKRYVWIFEVNMSYRMQKIEITSPSRWQVEIIRESTLNKEVPISIFKIRDIS